MMGLPNANKHIVPDLKSKLGGSAGQGGCLVTGLLLRGNHLYFKDFHIHKIVDFILQILSNVVKYG